MTSCADETVEKDVQTEDTGMEDKANQAPEDKMIDDYTPSKSAQKTSSGAQVSI